MVYAMTEGVRARRRLREADKSLKLSVHPAGVSQRRTAVGAKGTRCRHGEPWGPTPRGLPEDMVQYGE